MNANDIIEKCAEIADAYADEQDKTVRASCVAKSIRALKSTYAPGMTDLMVFPESLDEFMEANPLPAETVSEAMVERAALALYECEKARGENCASVIKAAKGHDGKGLLIEPYEENAETTWRPDARAALEAAALAPSDDGWRPISEAPNDRTPILCLNVSTGEIRVGIRKSFFEKSGAYEWFRDDAVIPGHTWSLTPTHWRPLPASPKDGRE